MTRSIASGKSEAPRPQGGACGALPVNEAVWSCALYGHERPMVLQSVFSRSQRISRGKKAKTGDYGPERREGKEHDRFHP